eukprot:TRINITY_DN821_c0_g2_i3.p1 TRINITY_DN821_c0_g2~~TRINITY_DN821_c0_g2_i3.p1  ORF type:complete len:665 (+),score=72.79 TRINITY_DN821_c0_g2_i3:68-1996(+)
MNVRAAYNPKTVVARREQERQEENRLRRLAEVGAVVKSHRPPRPSQPSSRFPSAEGSRHETPHSSPPVAFVKRRARSASPQTRMETLESHAPSPLRTSQQLPQSSPHQQRSHDHATGQNLPPPLRQQSPRPVNSPLQRVQRPPAGPRRAASSPQPRTSAARRAMSCDSHNTPGSRQGHRIGGRPPGVVGLELRQGRSPRPREQGTREVAAPPAEAWQSARHNMEKAEESCTVPESVPQSARINPDKAEGSCTVPESVSEMCPASPSAPCVQSESDMQAQSLSVNKENKPAVQGGNNDLASGAAIQDWLAQANKRLEAAFAPVQSRAETPASNAAPVAESSIPEEKQACGNDLADGSVDARPAEVSSSCQASPSHGADGQPTAGVGLAGVADGSSSGRLKSAEKASRTQASAQGNSSRHGASADMNGSSGAPDGERAVSREHSTQSGVARIGLSARGGTGNLSRSRSRQEEATGAAAESSAHDASGAPLNMSAQSDAHDQSVRSRASGSSASRSGSDWRRTGDSRCSKHSGTEGRASRSHTGRSLRSGDESPASSASAGTEDAPPAMSLRSAVDDLEASKNQDESLAQTGKSASRPATSGSGAQALKKATGGLAGTQASYVDDFEEYEDDLEPESEEDDEDDE